MRNEIINLQPAGWETDPDDEFFKLSTLDHCVPPLFNPNILIFKLLDDDKPKAAQVLKSGLEFMLSQCRQLCGTLEEHPDGGLCFHKKKDSTVEFHIQWLDSTEDEDKYPSFDELEDRHFVSQALGDINTWCVAPMTAGEKPEASPTSHPKASAFKANFIRGGLVFVMHHHHYANDIMGWAGALHQLAENCAAIWKCPDKPDLPPWNPACLDNSITTAPDPPEEQRVDGPVPPPRHPDHKPGQLLLLFHLSKSKAAELKKLASPADRSYWISTYDAFMALIWRTLTKHRAKVFNPDPKQPLIWAEAVEMRRRLRDPPVPPRIQGNIVTLALSMQLPIPPLTVEEVISTASLSKLAWYIRQLTLSVTPSALQTTLRTVIAPVRDKSALNVRIDAFPPLSNVTTDWRDARPCDADFGFGRPCAFRFPFDRVTAGMTVVLPPRDHRGGGGDNDGDDDDEGWEVLVAVEREVVGALLEDEEWGRWWEFRGVDLEERL